MNEIKIWPVERLNAPWLFKFQFLIQSVMGVKLRFRKIEYPWIGFPCKSH